MPEKNIPSNEANLIDEMTLTLVKPATKIAGE